jgi:hypothetical protein
MKMKVIGWKHSKGEFNGNAYDYVTIYTLARLEQKDNQRGSAGIEMRGESQLVEKLKKIDFGSEVVCDVETETRATGKGQFAEMVVNVLPVAAVASAMAAKA